MVAPTLPQPDSPCLDMLLATQVRAVSALRACLLPGAINTFQQLAHRITWSQQPHVAGSTSSQGQPETDTNHTAE